MTPEVTFIIPISPAHFDLATRAIESVRHQTVECKYTFRQDKDRRGPGAIRNELLALVDTEFVSFLDADDWLEPTFAEETDWLDASNQPIAAPCKNGPQGTVISTTDQKPYCGGTWHVLTTLLPTQWARDVGGFDETLPAVEDTDFYLKLCVTMRCGHRLARPLFHYSPDGGRARDFHNSPNYQSVMGAMTQRYGGKVGCCGGDAQVVAPMGEKQEGDVQAMALWHGNRSEYGRITGRMYPRISYPKTTWVDPRDVVQSPILWKKLEAQPVDRREGLTQVSQIAQIAMAGVKQQPAIRPEFLSGVDITPPVVNAKPNVSRVVNLAKATGDPVFVFSEKPYPSYSDIRRLVELSGFKTVTTKQIDAFSRAPYIVVSPEPIPDLNGLKARVICWQLEYAGDYTNNYDGFTGEVWASDKAWADEHNAKYVLMGSHEGLKLDQKRFDPAYDVTMLGYLTPRRQSIKDKLTTVKWFPVDYPGHGTPERDAALKNTRLMLHVHQHNEQPYVAPQRVALAAAYHMPMISEKVRDPGDLERFIVWKPYINIPATVKEAAKSTVWDGDALYEYLCVRRTFRTCVEEALKSS